MVRFSALLGLFAALGCTSTPATTAFTVDPNACIGTEGSGVTDQDPHFIYDCQGRALILRGANAGSSAKVLPHEPSITEADIARFGPDWGMNFARFLIFWDGIEPQKGVIDEAYLDRVGKWLDLFAKHNVYVLLDMHQDVYATKFCCDGAPDWAVWDDGKPSKPQPIWSMTYLQPGVQAAFDHFWNYADTDKELQDHYGLAWEAVVKRFHNHPAVIGYDLMNEPNPGSMVDITELLGVPADDSQSPAFDAQKFGPFYQRLINRLRPIDPDKWFFFEPRFGAPGAGLPQFLPKLVDPRPTGPRITYSPHLYSVSFEANETFDEKSDHTVAEWQKYRAIDQQTQNSSLVLGEWGFDYKWPGAATHMTQILTMADQMMAGWAYWSYDPGGWSFVNADATHSEAANANQLVRAYPRRIAGTPKNFLYDPEKKTLHLEFVPDPRVTAPTEVYIPAKRHFANGYVLTVNRPAAEWKSEWDPKLELLTLTLLTPATTLVVVDVAPKTN